LRAEAHVLLQALSEQIRGPDPNARP